MPATFDTREFAQMLHDAGVPPVVADTQAGAVAEAVRAGLRQPATVRDLKAVEQRLVQQHTLALTEVRGEVRVLTFALGAVIALLLLLLSVLLLSLPVRAS